MANGSMDCFFQRSVKAIAMSLDSVTANLALKARFHYTGPTGFARTRTDFVGDKHRPNGVSRRPAVRKKVRAGPCGSGRARVVEFSLNTTRKRFIVGGGDCGIER